MLRYIAIFFIILSLGACKPRTFTPKPPGYFRLDTPAVHTYQLFDDPAYPYVFEYPAYSVIRKDTAFQGEKADNPYWINIFIDTLGAQLNLTYKPITATQTIYKLEEDAWNLSFFHHEKADYITPEGFRNQYGVSGVLYTVGGNSASRYQFTATDSVKNFIRGALYFDVTPNADSLKPATDFLVQDIQHMLLTLRWRNSSQPAPAAAKK